MSSRRPAGPTGLPAPDPAAAAHEARVVAHLRERIAAAGGWIPFADYMHEALYAPGLGYYASGARKFGPGGDFVTGPEVTPLFGRALATQIAAVLDGTAGREIVELGAGSGRLAADLLHALAKRNAAPSCYAILEVSPELRERQKATIARDGGALAGRVQWIDALPGAIRGLVLMNEVLDAIPPHVVARRGGAWFERGVALDAGGRFAWDERPLPDGELRRLAAERFPAGIDYASEVNPAAEALVRDLGTRLAEGALVAIDYGFPRSEYYHPQRSEGTLMVHYRHRAHADPFVHPGLSDLTAHVDFTAIAEAGVAAGLEVAGYASQAALLLGCGLLDRLAESGQPGSLPYVKATAAVQTLVSPAEMGELFKAIALARTPGLAWPGFALGDARHRL